MSSKPFSKKLQDIITDNTSGSRELLNKLVSYLSDHREEINSELVSSLEQYFSDFQTIQDFLSNLNSALEENSIDEFLSKYGEQRIFENIYKNLKPEIVHLNSFVTISNSKTILEVLRLLAKEKESLEIFVSEGRPILEGQILAENLASRDISATLITEAQLYDTIRNCNCGIIGADKVLLNGNVVNKVGSNLLALACNKFNKPLLVLADKTKFSKDNSFDKKEMPRVEIYKGKDNDIRIDNYYFEEIPKEYITKIITD